MSSTWRVAYATLAEARAELAAGIRDVQADNPDMEEEYFVADLIESIAMICTAEVGYELCRRELGWVPSGLRRLRPDIAALEDKNN